MIERVVEMATALSTHLSALAMNKIPAASEHRQQILKDITVDKLLQGRAIATIIGVNIDQQEAIQTVLSIAELSLSPIMPMRFVCRD